ncbi:hypothetical protein HID58_018463, partial [Brassica napus]
VLERSPNRVCPVCPKSPLHRCYGVFASSGGEGLPHTPPKSYSQVASQDFYQDPVCLKRCSLDYYGFLGTLIRHVLRSAAEGMFAFQSLITSCDLTDLASIGPTFTWTNKQPVNPIAKKLYRVLVNDNWLSQFPQSYANFEPSGVSDHTRCWVHLTTPPPGNKRSFMFFNFLVDHPDFSDTVATVWESTEPLFHSMSALYRFHRKMKLLN